MSFAIEFINVVLTSHLQPFVEPSLDRLNMGTIIITCLVLFYRYLPLHLHALHREHGPKCSHTSMHAHAPACSIMLKIKPDAAEDPRDREIQVCQLVAALHPTCNSLTVQGVLLVVINVGVIFSGPIQFFMEKMAEVLEVKSKIAAVTAALALRLHQSAAVMRTRSTKVTGSDLSGQLASVGDDHIEELVQLSTCHESSFQYRRKKVAELASTSASADQILQHGRDDDLSIASERPDDHPHLSSPCDNTQTTRPTLPGQQPVPEDTTAYPPAPPPCDEAQPELPASSDIGGKYQNVSTAWGLEP